MLCMEHGKHIVSRCVSTLLEEKTSLCLSEKMFLKVNNSQEKKRRKTALLKSKTVTAVGVIETWVGLSWNGCVCF